jgi:hypothetical protein
MMGGAPVWKEHGIFYFEGATKRSSEPIRYRICAWRLRNHRYRDGYERPRGLVKLSQEENKTGTVIVRGGEVTTLPRRESKDPKG